MNRLPVVPVFLLASLAVVSGCASVPPVNMTEPRRVVGTESAVRIDAEVVGDELQTGTPLPITYEVTNNRTAPIAIADIVSETTYDAETNMLTVNIGSEVPGATLLPRLIAIAPGEKKTFSTSARMVAILQKPSSNPQRSQPLALRLKVNFLGDTTGLDDLVAMTEKAVADSKRADEVFPVWLERNEAVYTNAIPMRFTRRTVDETTAVPERPATTGRRARRG